MSIFYLPLFSHLNMRRGQFAVDVQFWTFEWDRLFQILCCNLYSKGISKQETHPAEIH